jgi:hypothetical protein
MKKRGTVDPMSITVGPAAEVRDLSDDPTALAEAQATLKRLKAKQTGRAMIAAARCLRPRSGNGRARGTSPHEIRRDPLAPHRRASSSLLRGGPSRSATTTASV